MSQGVTPLMPGTGLWVKWAARIVDCLDLNTAGSRATSGSFADLVSAAAQRAGLPEELVRAVAQAESNFDPHAVSSAGAKGLMQLMDGTARTLGVDDPFDPAESLAGGATYLRQLLDRYHSVPLALAAYNAGPGAVDRYGGIPPYAETQSYVKRVLELYGCDWEA